MGQKMAKCKESAKMGCRPGTEAWPRNSHMQPDGEVRSFGSRLESDRSPKCPIPPLSGKTWVYVDGVRINRILRNREPNKLDLSRHPVGYEVLVCSKALSGAIVGVSWLLAHCGVLGGGAFL